MENRYCKRGASGLFQDFIIPLETEKGDKKPKETDIPTEIRNRDHQNKREVY
jgi:hypothetical protein